jgi:hypothetical protein
MKLKSITKLKSTIKEVEAEDPKDGGEISKVYKLILQDLKRALMALTGYVGDDFYRKQVEGDKE